MDSYGLVSWVEHLVRMHTRPPKTKTQNETETFGAAFIVLLGTSFLLSEFLVNLHLYWARSHRSSWSSYVLESLGRLSSANLLCWRWSTTLNSFISQIFSSLIFSHLKVSLSLQVFSFDHLGTWNCKPPV